MLRLAIVCVALAGCVPVSYSTSPQAIRDAAPTLQREGTAIVEADVDDDPPSRGSPSASKLDEIRLDEPIRVRLAAQPVAWSSSFSSPPGAEQTMTVAELFADCPPDLHNSEANRLAYPRCRLFRADAIRLHGGHRVDKSKIALAGGFAAAAGDIACAAECGPRARDAALGILLGSVSVGGLVLFVHELFKDEGPRN